MTGRETPEEEFTRRKLNERLYQLCFLGERPGLMLAPDRRKRLVNELAEEGWTAERIAEHTKLSPRYVRRLLS